MGDWLARTTDRFWWGFLIVMGLTVALVVGGYALIQAHPGCGSESSSPCHDALAPSNPADQAEQAPADGPPAVGADPAGPTAAGAAGTPGALLDEAVAGKGACVDARQTLVMVMAQAMVDAGESPLSAADEKEVKTNRSSLLARAPAEVRRALEQLGPGLGKVPGGAGLREAFPGKERELGVVERWLRDACQGSGGLGGAGAKPSPDRGSGH